MKGTVINLKVALIVANLLALANGLLAQALPIVFDQQITNGGGSFGTMRSFGVAGIACRSESGHEPATIVDVLGPSVKSLTVQGYDTTRFETQEEVRDYVRAMLTARPESDQMTIFQVWSEGGSIQVVIVTEWMDGRFGRFDLGSLGAGTGNQYAHLEDHRGCERWGRFSDPRR